MLQAQACPFRCDTWIHTVAAARPALHKLDALALQAAKQAAVRVVEYEGNASNIFILIQYFYDFMRDAMYDFPRKHGKGSSSGCIRRHCSDRLRPRYA